MQGTAILFLTHGFAPWVARRFERLQRETAGFADCFVLLQDDHGPMRDAWAAFLGKIGHASCLVPFDAGRLAADLGYDYFVLRGHVLGSAHLPLMPFARRTSYRRLWRIEFDVEWRGAWPDFFSRFENSNAALLASHVRAFADDPRWSHWRTFRAPPGEAAAREQLLRAFFPISRFTGEALARIDDAHKRGFAGHYEVMVPTVLRHAGLEVRDLTAADSHSSQAPSYIPGKQKPAADTSLQSSMRWRPDVHPDEFKSRGEGPYLFHPIKGPWYFDGRQVVTWQTASSRAGAAMDSRARDAAVSLPRR